MRRGSRDYHNIARREMMRKGFDLHITGNPNGKSRAAACFDIGTALDIARFRAVLYKFRLSAVQVNNAHINCRKSLVRRFHNHYRIDKSDRNGAVKTCL